ncbi:toxin coregulated pilus biosynthesis protein E [mine drainage metagenome]|uniref:Toxin coregulated pilus biosynthesis protein E n=1 Tax=mine drainage metagenome TaxID=410659 RepID=A0A1J5SWR2_9ZZZZ
MRRFDVRMFFARREFAQNREHYYESIANSMLKDGVPLLECLQKMAKRNDDDKRPVGKLFRLWVKRMGDTSNKGEFSTVIKKDVPNSDYMVLKGFERAAQLPDGIMYQSKLIKKMKKMRGDFIMSMVKPIISLLAVLGLSSFFSAASRSFIEIAPMNKWPELSQYMFKWTIFVSDYLLLIIVLLVALVSWIVWSMPQWGRSNVRLRHTLDSHLPYVMYRDFTAFSTLIVLSSLMASGTPLKISCQMILDTGNPWIRSYFRKIVKRLGDANITAPVKAFDVGFFPKEIFYRILDASDRGGFDAAIKRIAEDSFENMEASMKKRAFLMDQVTLLVAGGIACLIALGLVSAIGAVTAILKS